MAFCEFWYWSGRSGTCRLLRAPPSSLAPLPGAVAGPKGCLLTSPTEGLPEDATLRAAEAAEGHRGQTEAVDGEDEEAFTTVLPLVMIGKSEVENLEDEGAGVVHSLNH